jgi:hypothetical protein
MHKLIKRCHGESHWELVGLYIDPSEAEPQISLLHERGYETDLQDLTDQDHRH